MVSPPTMPECLEALAWIDGHERAVGPVEGSSVNQDNDRLADGLADGTEGG